jgi:hypothetical protein
VVNFAQSWIVIAMFLRETALVCAAIKVLLKKFRCKVFISVTWTYKIWSLFQFWQMQIFHPVLSVKVVQKRSELMVNIKRIT